MLDRQRQVAGTGAQQLQVSGDLVIHQGISEERAREIADETMRAVVSEYTEEANAIGSARIAELDGRVVRQLADSGYLGAFADPAFQVLLKKAQIGAACTDRESDYDVLTRLLDDRVRRGADRPIRAGIDRAVQIVDQLDESALVGLTVFRAVQQFSPSSGGVREGLETMDTLFGQLLVVPLPDGNEWLDHLDILDAVRVNPSGTLKTFHQFYPEAQFPGYLAAGVEAGSEAEAHLVASLVVENIQVPLVAHELRPGHLRVPFSTSKNLENALAKHPRLSPAARETLLRVAQEDAGLGLVDTTLIGPVMDMVDALPSLGAVKRWWDEIPSACQLTAVGRVLATANAKRCDVQGLLPDLD